MSFTKRIKIIDFLATMLNKNKYNKYNHISAALYKKKIIYWHVNDGLHAEEHIIKYLIKNKNFLNLNKIGKYSIIILRIQNNMFKLSKPCENCCEKIKKSKLFKNVIWSTDYCKLEQNITKELNSDHKSNYYKHLMKIGN